MALEAQRNRTPEQVIAYTSRSELLEVVYFYCGVQVHAPTTAGIVSGLLNRGEYLTAARCLINARHVPTEELIGPVLNGLDLGLQNRNTTNACLQALSSLSQRTSPAFLPFRERFHEIVHGWLSNASPTKAELVSILGANTELAMLLMPSLLQHAPYPAVRLLRDIGSDEEAIDELVRLTTSHSIDISFAAAQVIVGMLQTSRNCKQQP